MGQIIVSEGTYAKDQIVDTPTVPVDVTADGWVVRVDLQKLGDDASKRQATIQAFADFGAGFVALCVPIGIRGGVLDRHTGKPATTATIGGTWPGAADSQTGARVAQKPIAVLARLIPGSAVTTTIELDTSVKVSAAIDAEAVGL